MAAVPPPPRALERVRVLVVEDDEDAIAITSAVLAREGAIVVCARSVDDALASAERTRPDVIVADLMMPGRGGADLLAAIRARVDDVPTIAVSAGVDWTTADELRALGFDAVVAKPFELTELVAVVAEAAHEARRRGRVPPPRRSGTVSKEALRAVRGRRRSRAV